MRNFSAALLFPTSLWENALKHVHDEAQVPYFSLHILKKGKMSQGRYTALIAHILYILQQVIQDAGRPYSYRQWRGEDWVGGYVREHKSFIALKKIALLQGPSFAFPPAIEQQLRAAEQQLEFSLPSLLRLMLHSERRANKALTFMHSTLRKSI